MDVKVHSQQMHVASLEEPMKSVLSAIQRHGLVCASPILTAVLVVSCGSQITFSSAQPAPKATQQANVTVKKTAVTTAATSEEVPTVDLPEMPPIDPVVDPVAIPTPAPSIAVVPTPVPTLTIASASPTPTPSACPNTTVVTLMSSTFTNNALNQYVQYKLSQTDCRGASIPINVSEIRFDVQAHVVTGRTDIPFSAYLVTDPSHALASGTLQAVTGRDMFGTVNPSYWYYSTSNQISIPASTYEIYLSLDYSCSVIHPNGASGRPPATETINSYLAFGDASPVTQALRVSNSQLNGACR